MLNTKDPTLNAVIVGTTSPNWSSEEFVVELEKAIVSAHETIGGKPTDEFSPGLRLVYQPQLDLRKKKVVALEALLRWNHDVWGVIPPSIIIPAAEQFGLIRRITRWVLEKSASVVAPLPANIRLAINVSPVELHSLEFETKIWRSLARSNFDPLRLELEITETQKICASDQVKQLLSSLRKRGIRIALDDFGTAYSSLHALCALPIDVIKIDRSFVSELETSQRHRLTVEAMIALGEGLGVEVIAEGIATTSQYQLVKKLGCTIGQGFLIGRPTEECNLDLAIA